MFGLHAFSALVVILMLSACVAAFPEQRRWPIPRWRLAVPSLLITVATLVLLAVLGAVAARVGGADMSRGALRVMFWGALAMGASAVVGRLFGTTVG